jgi:hypothetical protein
MNPNKDYGVRQVRIPAGNLVQWSVPEGCYVIIQPRSDNANNVNLLTQDPTGAAAGTSPAWTLLAPTATNLDFVKLPFGYGGPIWINGTAGEHVTIWILPGAY